MRTFVTSLGSSLWIAALLLLPPLASAQTSTTIAVNGSSYSVEFLGSSIDASANTTTFSYRVTELEGQDLSHWTLELCVEANEEGEDDVVSWTPEEGGDVEEVNLGNDPTTGVYGIKWNFEDEFETGVFTVTLDGIYSVTSVDVAAKTGSGDDTATINGPSCAVECPSNGIGKPDWDGNFTATATGKAEFTVDTDNGFAGIELNLGSSNNIALEGVSEADGTPIPAADLSFSNDLTGSFANGSSQIQYTGSATITGVQVQVTALEPTNNARFLFVIEDQCGFEGQMDPVLTVEAPEAYALDQNYPNPFNPQTSIRFTLPEASDVSLAVYNLLGKRIKTLAAGAMSAGSHEVSWDGTDASGIRVPSGMYLYRLEAGDEVRIRRMTLLK